MQEYTNMFNPTIDNLYHLMKDMTVKPSIYQNTIWTSRVSNYGYPYRTVLNEHKDFVIAMGAGNSYRINLTWYPYGIFMHMGTLKHCVYIVSKYDKRNYGKFIPIHSVSAS